jgi:hypothetical protein
MYLQQNGDFLVEICHWQITHFNPYGYEYFFLFFFPRISYCADKGSIIQQQQGIPYGPKKAQHHA